MNFRFFLPKQSVFCEHMAELADIQREIALDFFDLANSFKDFEEHAKKAEELEHKADDKTHQIVRELNQTFIIPFDREDIYKVAQEFDDVVDLVENVISNIKESALIEFADLIKEASETLVKMSGCLVKLKYTVELRDLKQKMHDLETKGDRVFRKAVSEFIADGRDPVRIIKWKDILEDLENIMDKYQQVGDTIEGIIVKFN
ncbi:MAG: DUF47 family protein [Candidatus Moranbacteria bacterium]|nr:DUF47 family protein [Candidatus Moranbacteria bacterium]